VLKGAQVYITLHEYNKAIEDCDNAIKLNPTLAKAHMRKAVALMQLTQEPDSMSRAITSFKHALSIAEDKEIIAEIESTLKFAEKELLLDSALPMDHPERVRYNTML